jgi:hypothetical protein
LRLLPQAVLELGRWTVVRGEAEAQAFEPVWLRLHTATAHVRSPGEWIAERCVHLAGPALLHAGTRPWVVALGGVVALLLGTGSGGFGWRAPGFVLLALAWVLARVAGLMTRIERKSLLETGKRAPTGVWFELAIDAAFVTLAAWRSDIPQMSGMPLAVAWPFALTWFAPLVMMALLHFLPRVVPDGRMTWWLRDRLVLGVALAAISVALPFDFCLRAGVLGLLVWAIAITPQRVVVTNPDLTKPH